MKRYGEGRGWDDKSLAGRGSVLSRGENTGNASVQREIGKTMADLLADNRRASDAKPSVEIKQVERGTGYVEPRKLEHVLDSFAGRNFDVAGNATAGRWAELRAEGIDPTAPMRQGAQRASSAHGAASWSRSSDHSRSHWRSSSSKVSSVTG
jgi:hypothetical protein